MLNSKTFSKICACLCVFLFSVISQHTSGINARPTQATAVRYVVAVTHPLQAREGHSIVRDHTAELEDVILSHGILGQVVVAYHQVICNDAMKSMKTRAFIYNGSLQCL